VITGTLAAAEAHGLPVERLTRAEVAARFPQHQNLGDDVVGVWDPDAGVAYPETAVVAAVRAAQAAGAEIQVDTRVTAVDLVDGGAVVRTDADSFTVRQVVVTASSSSDAPAGTPGSSSAAGAAVTRSSTPAGLARSSRSSSPANPPTWTPHL
jgi:glycine/D-amino acid oxidase-like deaminating enzyme